MGSASPKRTGSPAAFLSSPSHMAIFPRTTVPIGQPLTFRPAKGVHPDLLPTQSLSMTRSRHEVDDGQVGVIAERDAALAGDAENALRAGAGQIDEARKAEASLALTWSSITGTSVCTPGMPEGVAG